MANAEFLLLAAVKLRNLNDFSEFRKWIDEQQASALQVLASAHEDRKMYAAQGAYNTWQTIKNLIESSAEKLDKAQSGASRNF